MRSNNMNADSVEFEIKDKDVIVHGYPELEGCTGILVGDGMVFFFNKNKNLHIANTITGKIRRLSLDGILLVNDCEIDYEAITKGCRNGIHHAKAKEIRYEGINRWDGFKNGLCAISWMLYPDGRYFADSDGFGMEDNDEEEVYAIIDTELNIIEPFRPIKDVAAYLKKLREQKSETIINKTMRTKIFNLIIIDESGSMHRIKKQAIDSVNETIQTIRAAQKEYENQEHYVSLVSFHNNVKTIFECVPIAEVVELSSDNYQPQCCTALYDAIGMSLNQLCPKVATEDKVLVTVVTDGYENASKEYDGNAIKALVDELKKKGWVFAYIGANQNVEAVAESISITNTLNFSATCEGTAIMSEKLGRSRSRWFNKIAHGLSFAVEDNCDFFDEEKNNCNNINDQTNE